MSCETNRDLLELYALGALDPDEREEVEAHLRDRCEVCVSGLKGARALNAAILGALPLAEPSPGLRTRVANSVRPGSGTSKRPLAWMALAAGLTAATIWLGVERQRGLEQIAATRTQVSDLERSNDQLSSALNFLRDPETRPAVSKPGGPDPRGTYFANPRSGVMLIAANLPIPAPGRAYSMWVIPKGQAPRPAGLFKPAPNGSALHFQPGPVDLSTVAAFAITDEPESGSPAPTTTPFLVTPPQGL